MECSPLWAGSSSSSSSLLLTLSFFFFITSFWEKFKCTCCLFVNSIDYCLRVNHSCVPNAETSWKSQLNMMELVTTRNIRKGEEVTICYLNKVVKVFASSTGSLAKINGLTAGEKYCCKGPKSFVHQKKTRQYCSFLWFKLRNAFCRKTGWDRKRKEKLYLPPMDLPVAVSHVQVSKLLEKYLWSSYTF